MSDPSAALDDLKRYLKQRIDDGEQVHLAPGADAAPRATSGSPRLAPPASSRHSTSPPPAAALAGAADDRGAAASGEPMPAARVASPSGAQSADATDSIDRIAAEVRACTRCRLHETRTLAVPGVGRADADLVFIGEGPGAEEDRQGEPFVGRAGQLLTKIIESVKLERKEVFITNIVKCRPPGNRDPKPDEIVACEPFLKRQLNVLAPKVICALGRHAAMTLLKTNDSMARLRQARHEYEGIQVFPTYHPAALLRNPQWKRPVWEDIQNVRAAYDAPRGKILNAAPPRQYNHLLARMHALIPCSTVAISTLCSRLWRRASPAA